MLVLLLRLGDQCFGLDATDVVAVVPSALPDDRTPRFARLGLERARAG